MRGCYGDTLRDADWVHLLPEAPKGTRVQHRSHRRLFQDLILCLPHRGGKNWLDSINIIDREKVTDGGKTTHSKNIENHFDRDAQKWQDLYLQFGMVNDVVLYD